jgi:glycerophosphoryl diester phosphodiesterase
MQSPSHKVKIFAHRGASGEAPENTLEAFKLAIEQGADCLECDIRRSADGVLFLHHDAARSGQLLHQLTYSQILALPGAAAIPTLEAVIQLAHGVIELDIELKERGCEAEVLAKLRSAFTYEDFVLSSYDVQILQECRRLDSRVTLGLIVGKPVATASLLEHFRDFFPAPRVSRHKIDFVACHSILGSIFVQSHLRRRHIPVAVWTLNNAAQMKRVLRDKNVFAVITNYPKLAVEVRTSLERAD